MTRLLVVYYSSYGHIEQMAYAQAEGVAKVAGATVDVKRVPELVPPDVAKASGFKLDQAAPIAEPEELENYDGIIFGTPTRFGNMAAQMRNFFDRTGPLWMRNALVNKFGSREQLADGSMVTVDESYVRESILNPQAKLVAGYQPLMPTFQGLVNEESVMALIEYVKSLQQSQGGSAAAAAGAATAPPAPPAQENR